MTKPGGGCYACSIRNQFPRIMAFFAIFLALLIEQLRPLPLHNPVYHAYRRVADVVVRKLTAGQSRHGWLVWGVMVLVPAALVALVFVLLHAVGWFPALLWSAAVLYVTLGFRQFSHHITAIRDALDMGDQIRARQLLAEWKGNDTAHLPRSGIMRQVIEHAVLDAHRHVFGVLVAFLVGAALGLGPAGAVLFRGAEYVGRYWQEQRGRADGSVPIELAGQAQAAWNWINWLPARATAASFAIAGNFEQAVDNWRQAAGSPGSIASTDAEAVVLASAMGAVDLPWPLPLEDGRSMARLPAPGRTGITETGVDETEDTLEAAAPLQLGMQHLQLLVGLVWRAVLMWGGLIALVAVTAWVSG